MEWSTETPTHCTLGVCTLDGVREGGREGGREGREGGREGGREEEIRRWLDGWKEGRREEGVEEEEGGREGGKRSSASKLHMFVRIAVFKFHGLSVLGTSMSTVRGFLLNGSHWSLKQV